MSDNASQAPGQPGGPPRWTSSAKSGVGTARNSASQVWFTLSHGILDEVYYPRVDQACVRDLGLIVTDGQRFFSEEKRDAASEVGCLAPGVPAYRLVNTCRQQRYRIEKEILIDPHRNVLLQRIRFVPLQGELSDYHLYALLAPHVGNRGSGNTARVGEYKGVPMLLAERDGLALALACSAPWLGRSAGFVGVSDGWRDLKENYRMTWRYECAADGNVALTGEVDLPACGGVFVLSLGFGRNVQEAGHRARSALGPAFERARDAYLTGWHDWQKELLALERPGSRRPDLYRISTAVLRIHESKGFRGGTIASLSIPWGFAKGDDDLGGYHLVWPRDLVETAVGLLAAGAREDARRVLSYLQTTQEADGHWPQNTWLDGTPYWSGIQLDETALPILLVLAAHEEGVLRPEDGARFWPMVRRAASYLVCNGPVTPEDRWEEDPGYTPFTLSAVIAALLAAAQFAEQRDEPTVAAYLRETADAWYAQIDTWMYVTGELLPADVRKLGIEGYYVRTGAADWSDGSPLKGRVPIRNRPPDQETMPAVQVLSPDALALVRFGLRAADDPRMVNTVRLLDHYLKVDTPIGPCWYRYTEDGYGEHEDGSPYDGTGVGRLWPLLTGERAHYELAAGRLDEAQRLASALEAFANDGGMLPEQVWDSQDMPERELFFGRPSGSAMPLVWAHAEYIKLCRSLRDGRVFDTPRLTVQRYLVEKTEARHAFWRFNQKCESIPAGKVFRVEVPARAEVRWSDDGWKTVHDTPTRDTGLGIHLADIPAEKLPSGRHIEFTFYWSDAARWQGQDFRVTVE